MIYTKIYSHHISCIAIYENIFYDNVILRFWTVLSLFYHGALKLDPIYIVCNILSLNISSIYIIRVLVYVKMYTTCTIKFFSKFLNNMLCSNKTIFVVGSYILMYFDHIDDFYSFPFIFKSAPIEPLFKENPALEISCFTVFYSS